MGPQVAKVMEVMGTPAIPSTREMLDILFEYRPTRNGPVFRFREGTITVPRQCQKSTTASALLIHRVLLLSDLPQHAVYSAQSGHDARRKFMDDFVPVWKRSPELARFITRIRRASGHESVFFGDSRIEAISSNETAGHGRVIDLAVIDEAFADEDDRREQALLPAMLTRSSHTGGTPMMFTCSTAGTDSSTYLKRKVDTGRESVIEGRDNGIFFCEYAIPEDADLDDEAVWWEHHPGLGQLITIEALRHMRATMTESEFRRAGANQWVRTTDLLIPFDLWRAAQDTVAAPGTNGERPHFAVDVNPERTHSSIAAADKGGAVELIDHEPGTIWVPDRCHELLRRHAGSRLVVDARGPASTLLTELERVCGARRLKVTTAHEMANASATFYDGVVEGWMRMRPHMDMDIAVAGAKKRMRSDSFTWARGNATVDLSPLVAASLAVWFARNFRPPRPSIR